MKKLIIYSILLLLFVACLFLIFYIDTFSDSLSYRAVKTVEHSVSEYNSSSNDESINTPSEFVENIDKDLKEIQFTFNMKIESVDDYNNVFQTAPVNSGLRMELSQPSDLVFLSGIKSTESNALTSVQIHNIQLNTWYKIDINVQKNNRATIKVDNEVIYDQFVNYMKYEITDIAVGTGFSKTRPFKGEIKEFYMKYTLFDYEKSTDIYLKLTKIILSVGVLVLAYFILFPEEIKLKKR